VTTFYRWKRKYGGLEVNDAKKLKALEDENRRRKRMVADQALDLQALKLVLSKHSEARGRPQGRGPAAKRARLQRAPHVRPARCAANEHRYQSKRVIAPELLADLRARARAMERPRFGLPQAARDASPKGLDHEPQTRAAIAAGE
jgi:hypothetical protein